MLAEETVNSVVLICSFCVRAVVFVNCCFKGLVVWLWSVVFAMLCCHLGWGGLGFVDVGAWRCSWCIARRVGWACFWFAD